MWKLAEKRDKTHFQGIRLDSADAQQSAHNIVNYLASIYPKHMLSTEPRHAMCAEPNDTVSAEPGKMMPFMHLPEGGGAPKTHPRSSSLSVSQKHPREGETERYRKKRGDSD